MIPLVLLSPTLATSYDRAGRTRDALDRPWPHERLVQVGQVSKPESWRATPWMAAALVKLDERMRAAGAGGVRLTDMTRSYSSQTRLRAMYDNWVKAGRPGQDTKLFNRDTMKTAYAARPGESNHQWGAAVDFDVYALAFPEIAPSEQLAEFWRLARPLGFEPIITEPHLDQPECWHFDCLGPMLAVRDLFVAAGSRSRYASTALAGIVLAGMFTGDLRMERLVQARLLLHGIYCGPCDGIFGRLTLGALAKAGIPEAKKGTPAALLLARMDQLHVGVLGTVG